MAAGLNVTGPDVTGPGVTEVVAAGSAASPPTDARGRWEVALPYLLALGFFAAFATLSIARYERMATRSWDLAIFEQAISSYAHLHWPIADIKTPGYPLLGDHFSPLISVFAPFYRAFPTPVTLLAGQAALLAVSVVPVTRIGMRLLGRATGVTIGLAYGLSWGLQTAVDFDFHEIALAIPLLAFSLEALLRRRWWSCVLWAAPLMLVKEDLGLTVAALGVVIAIRGRRRLGAGVVAYGVVASALILGVIIPALNPRGQYDYWSKLGGTGEASLGAFATSALSAVGHLLTPTIKLQTLFLLLGITGFLALRSSLIILVVPTLAWRFLSDNDYYWGQDWHYNAILMPILFMALIDAIAVSRASGPGWLRAYSVRVPAVALTIAVLLCAHFPFQDLVDPATYRASLRAPVAMAAVAAVPAGTSVESDLGLLTPLVSAHRVFWIGAAPGEHPDYIAIDSASWTAPTDLPRYASQLHPGTTYRIVFDQGGYTILKRVSP